MSTSISCSPAPCQALTPTESLIFEVLTRRAGAPVPIERIAVEVWGETHTLVPGWGATIWVHISHLRRKLAPSQRIIRHGRPARYTLERTTP